jgi:ADP-ribosylglycohydrolase
MRDEFMAIVGAILGDIAGSKWEFVDPSMYDYKTVELFTTANYFTDDTVLTVATKYALKNELDFSSVYRMFGNRYPDRGYGIRFRNWLANESAGSYYSCGNGSAMRVSPVVDFSKHKVKELAYKTAACTHDHPEGMRGAMVTAVCGNMASKGASKRDILQFAESEYPSMRGMTLRNLRESYCWDDTCQGSVPVAIRCFIESEDYENFLRNVLSLDCDTDTVAAIGGGIAEEFYKGTGFDEEVLLQKYLDEYLYDIVMS